MARRVIDLSQPLSRESQLHPFFPPTQVLRHLMHADYPEGRPSFNAEIVLTSNHAATHVDAFGHYDRNGEKITELPLDWFCGDALCVDIRDYPGGHDVTAAEVEKAVADSGQELRQGDILLFCSDHYNRTAGTPAFLDGFNGISAEAVHWMADRGVKIFGVETISPDLTYITDEYPTHRACAERRLTHYENLNDLKEVVNRRFQFFGFPLRLEPAYGSPVRAVGIVDD
jgi:kynurenine formamidase